MNRTWIQIAAALIGLSACNVIKPELLEQNDASTTDARPRDAAPIDAPPDAYVPSEGNLVMNPGLESGTPLGWTTNGGAATIALSTTQAHGGTRSLTTGARSGEWNGPAVAMFGIVRQTRSYTATVWARLVETGTDDFFVSVRHTCAETGGTERFNVNNTRTSATGNATSWVQPSSTFTVVGTGDCTLSSFIVYVESETLADFYVDDLDVREIP